MVSPCDPTTIASFYFRRHETALRPNRSKERFAGSFWESTLSLGVNSGRQPTFPHRAREQKAPAAPTTAGISGAEPASE